MYTIITYYDDWENRPWSEVAECETEEELKELLEDIGPDQHTPMLIETRILNGGDPVYRSDIMKEKL